MPKNSVRRKIKETDSQKQSNRQIPTLNSIPEVNNFF